MVVYVPHRGRTRAPYAEDTLEKIRKLLTTIRKTDCIILMGDLNCELQRNVENCTGKWYMTKRKDNGNGEKVLDLMRAFDTVWWVHICYSQTTYMLCKTTYIPPKK